MLENMGGDWRMWRRQLRGDRARLVATRRTLKMLEVAQAHDSDVRHELKNPPEGR